MLFVQRIPNKRMSYLPPPDHTHTKLTNGSKFGGRYQIYTPPFEKEGLLAVTGPQQF